MTNLEKLAGDQPKPTPPPESQESERRFGVFQFDHKKDERKIALINQVNALRTKKRGLEDREAKKAKQKEIDVVEAQLKDL